MGDRIIIDVTSDVKRAAESFREGHEIRIYPFGGFERAKLAQSLEEIMKNEGALFAVVKEMRGESK